VRFLIYVALIPPARARGDYRGMWGTDELVYFSRYDGLMYFRVTPLGAHCLGAEPGYSPASVEVKPVLRRLLEQHRVGRVLIIGEYIRKLFLTEQGYSYQVVITDDR
jgi:hypothetical protein